MLIIFISEIIAVIRDHYHMYFTPPILRALKTALP